METKNKNNISSEEQCPKCWGKGYYYETVPGTEDNYIPDYKEKYCFCSAGEERKKRERH